MTRALRLARFYGIAVRFADLGDWGRDELRAEYDPAIPEIRINARIAARMSGRQRDAFVALAVGHELYHHRERIGRVTVPRDRRARESAATNFARELLEGLV